MSDTAATAAAADEVKYRGVRKRKWGKYVSEIRLPNCRDRIWLGSYDTAEKAARAFDAAQFCLRGPTANFNFPLDPPDIAGGRSLSPPEIQAVAQRYGNSYGGGPTPRAAGGDDGQFRARALEDVATTSSDIDRAGAVDLIDGAFWEMVDNAGSISGSGLSPEPDVYPYFETRVYENTPYNETRVNENEDESYDHMLWNF